MMITRKEKYRLLCKSEKTIPIFSRDWWLDAVCGDDWDVCLVEKGGAVVATMPYFKKTSFGMVVITQPKLTQTLGPWLRKPQNSQCNRLGIEKDLHNELIRQLPKFDHFAQNWHHSNQNWLPYYWCGFQQTTRYTYRILDLTNTELIWSRFRDNIRGDIRKSSNRFMLNVRTDLGVEQFLRLNQKTYERQGLKPPYQPDLVYRIDQACKKNSAGQLFLAEDRDKNLHSGVYIIWDQQSAYYLMGGSDPGLRSSGAMSLCLWEAIKFSASKTKSFDFEGSMAEQIERFFRAFGTIQTPYFSIVKTPSKMLRTATFLKSLYRTN
jgi:hypothetical protein